MIANECSRRFHELVDHKNADVFLQHFVAQFGQDEPEADIRWVLCFHDMLLVSDVRYRDGPDFDLQNRIAENQLRHWINHPDDFERYYRMCVSFRTLLGRRGGGLYFLMLAKKTNEQLRAADEKSYWMDLRNAWFLMYATSRNDLLEDVNDPKQDVRQAYMRWYQWLFDNGNIGLLRPHEDAPKWKSSDSPTYSWAINRELPALDNLPTKPFNDWKQAIPPPTYRTLSGINPADVWCSENEDQPSCDP